MLALVPWIATSERFRVIAAAPMGLRGEPPGITLESAGWSRSTTAGADHAGGANLPLTKVSPWPSLPRPADRDRIAHGSPGSRRKIEPTLTLLDNDRAGGIGR